MPRDPHSPRPEEESFDFSPFSAPQDGMAFSSLASNRLKVIIVGTGFGELFRF